MSGTQGRERVSPETLGQMLIDANDRRPGFPGVDQIEWTDRENPRAVVLAVHLDDESTLEITIRKRGGR